MKFLLNFQCTPPGAESLLHQLSFCRCGKIGVGQSDHLPGGLNGVCIGDCSIEQSALIDQSVADAVTGALRANPVNPKSGVAPILTGSDEGIVDPGQNVQSPQHGINAGRESRRRGYSTDKGRERRLKTAHIFLPLAG